MKHYRPFRSRNNGPNCFVLIVAAALALSPAAPAQAQQGTGSTSQDDAYKKATDALSRHEDATALQTMQGLAAQNYVPAQMWLGVYFRRHQQYPEAIQWLRRAADNDNPDAQLLLGISYAQGKGVNPDDSEALRWFRRAAEHGLATAEYLTGGVYEEGRGTPVNFSESAKWFRRAADHGSADGQCRLGVAFEFGRGVTQDNSEAVRWYQKAAEQGNARCQYRLATMYRDHLGVAKDDGVALQWLTKAADQGYAPALTLIGWYYQDGHYLKQDLAKAADYFRKAAALNDSDDGGKAEGMLGAMYQTGQGVVLDHVEAMKWLFKSAELGNGQSMFEIGLIFEAGAGEAANFGKAVSWYQKAAETGNADAKKRLEELQSQSQGGKPVKPAIPNALQARCFLEVDVDALRDGLPETETVRRHDDCLRRNWKRLFGSKPFPADQ